MEWRLQKEKRENITGKGIKTYLERKAYMVIELYGEKLKDINKKRIYAE